MSRLYKCVKYIRQIVITGG